MLARPSPASTIRRARLVATLPLVAVVLVSSCGRERPRPVTPHRSPPPEPATYQSEVEEGIGAAVMVVVDTSGSMKEQAHGDTRPKHEVAREAIGKMLAATDAFAQKRPDFAIKVGIMHFSSDAWVDLPLGPHDLDKQKEALAKIPNPGGGTAIGKAMRAARPWLYRSGVFRKYLIVVTDGENTSGPPPDHVAREIHARSEGAVQIYFVAFDTSPEKFAFLDRIGGAVVRAGNGAELERALRDIYEGKILAEAIDAGEKLTDRGR
jgi:Mg-chelatase subunit ChlD